MNASRDIARKALAVALDPASCLVDGRGHRDRLAFAAEFAKLIVYYDSNNQVAGDWRPFFLKDPAILMAAISNARPESYFSTFSPGRLMMASAVNADDSDIVAIGQLCTLSMNLFSMLDQWYLLMDQAPQAYVLHPFLKARIETSLGEQLWTMVALQQALSIKSQGRIAPPEYLKLRQLAPIWETLRTGRREAIDVGFSEGRVELQQIYQTVYGVFTQVVEYAGHAFHECENQPTRFPDTALLMVFSRLMEIQQAELNTLGRKHLDFYYEQVLKLETRPAQADEMYVCVNLQTGNDTFSLPAGTPFKAGTYADGSDILFVNDEALPLSRATVISAGAPFYSPEGPSAGLYLNTVSDADSLLVTPTQGVRSWPAWGSAEGVVLQPGFAFASPMLLLGSGLRTITLGMQFADTQAGEVLLEAGTRYCLSTEKGWFEVSPETPMSAAANGELTLQFKLQPTDPAIVALKPGLDSASSPWPMLKFLLTPAQAVKAAPQVLGITLSVEVNGASAVSLANDLATLPLTGSVQLFGPIPVVGSSFYVGSNECFAKPLTDLQVSVDWEGVPADFAQYYAAYNQYLTQTPRYQGELFSNTSFRVSGTTFGSPDGVESSLTDMPLFQQVSGQAPSAELPAPQINADRSTFTFITTTGKPVAASPSLALGSLPAVNLTKAGYVRLQLTAPVFVFGHGLYAKVVTAVSLHNAQALIALAKEEAETLADKLAAGIKHAFSTLKRWIAKLFGKPTPPPQPSPAAGAVLLDMPSLPFSPAIKAVSLHYSASATINLAESTPQAQYPLSLFHYGPFMTSPVFDAQQPSGGAIALYPQLGIGSFFLALGGVNAPCTVSLLVGVLADDRPLAAEGTVLSCYGWNVDGWYSVEVLKDETQNLRCTGIITLEISAPDAQPPLDAASLGLPTHMPGDAFWLAVSANSQDRAVRFTCIKTQAVKLRRLASASMPVGDVPWVAANTPITTQQKVKQIASVVQPFASFGGLAGEDRDSFDRPNSFYRRVSARLNHKDRASSASHYVDLAYEACPALYHARVLGGEGSGSVCIGLVNGYADAQLPEAFAPLVSAVDLPVIERYLTRRTSAMAQLSVCNLQHQIVQVQAQLVLAPQANTNTVIKALNRKLRLYLSPWIKSAGAQMDIDKGVSRSALINVMTAHADVLSVSSLKVVIAPPGQALEAAMPDASDPLQASPQAILVSAASHLLTATTRQAGLEASHASHG